MLPARGMRIVVVGGGEIGHALARALAADHSIVISLGAEIVTEITASIATPGNIGPGFNGVGQMGHFGVLHPVSKLVLTSALWIGRPELLAVLALLPPEVWSMARWEKQG